METPTIGRIVHYVMPLGHPAAGAVRPAQITKVWSPTCVNLRVTLDIWDEVELERNDQSSVCLSLTNQPRTWHWPDRAPNRHLPIIDHSAAPGSAADITAKSSGGPGGGNAPANPSSGAGPGPEDRRQPLSTGEQLLGVTAATEDHGTFRL